MFLRKKTEPKTHDYTNRIWGHDFYVRKVIKNGKKIELAGWGYGISTGDYLMLPNDEGVTRYRINTIEYMRDPTDMWFADATHAPR